MTDDAPTVHFDHHAPEFAEDPWSVYDDLRSRCPVAYSETYGGFWVLSKYDDVKEVALDDETFSSAQSVTVPPKPADARPSIPIEVDPPLFREYRRILNPWFSASFAKRMEPTIHSFVTSCIDGFIEKGSCDAVQDFANPIPAMTTLRLIGLPVEEWEDYAVPLHAKTFLREEHKQQEHYQRMYDDMHQRVWDAIADRRRSPRDDMISQLMDAAIEDRRLTDDEIFDIVMLTLHGGFDTTGAAISNAMLYLDQDHVARQRLQTEPGLLDKAVDEFLRYEAPQQGLARVATEDCEIRGQKIEKGERILLLWGSANRDEEEFERPDEVVLDRWPNPHVTFGIGAHRCLGAHLARIEMRVALEEVLRRLPDYRVEHEGIVRAESVGVVFGHFAIPIEFTPGPVSDATAGD